MQVFSNIFSQNAISDVSKTLIFLFSAYIWCIAIVWC